MSSRARLVLAVALGVALLAVSTGGFAAVTVWRAGSIVVSVDPKDTTEPRVSLRFPAAVVPAALAFVPDAAFRGAEPQLRVAIPLALRACELLEGQGDAVFVDIVDRHETVRIAKVGATIRIDVISEDEEVHVAVPISSFRSVLARLDRAVGSGPARA